MKRTEQSDKTKRYETTPVEKLLGACKTGAKPEDLKKFHEIEKMRERQKEVKRT